MTLSPEKIEEILRVPEKSALLADLKYVQDKHLTITRKKRGRGFSYFHLGEHIKDKERLKRIKSLIIPPAWQQVRISELENGHLQCVGRDEKNRKQYLYHEMWTQIRNQTKFYKMVAFAEALPHIREQIEHDLQLPGMPLAKCLALVLSVMEETHIRIGNQNYARTNKTYGLSTMRTRHLKENHGSYILDFIGKRGKEHKVEISDRQLKKLIHQCEEIPGWELFKYYDDNGQHHSIDSGMVNEYIQSISGDLFSAKDFRTWAATVIFYETAYSLGHSKDQKTREKNIIACYDEAAEGLGNTRAVCRNYYVHPQVVDTYDSGEIQSYFDKMQRLEEQNYMSPAEQMVKEIIQDFEIKVREV